MEDAPDPTAVEAKRRRGKVWLYRSLLLPPATIIRDAGLFQLWGYLLLRASYKTRRVKLSTGRGEITVEIAPGQLITSAEKLAEFLRSNSSSIRYRLSRLKKMGCIAVDVAPHYSLVSVLNWGVYQPTKKAGCAPSCDPSADESCAPSCAPSCADFRAIQERDSKESNANSSRRALRFDDGDRRLAEHIWDSVRALNPGHKPPNLDAWTNDIRLTRERDKRTLDDLRAVFDAASRDSFWQANILSPGSLRKQFDKLKIKFANGGTNAKPRNGHHAGSGQVYQQGGELDVIT